jgi:hypothetical protein
MMESDVLFEEETEIRTLKHRLDHARGLGGGVRNLKNLSVVGDELDGLS